MTIHLTFEHSYRAHRQAQQIKRLPHACEAEILKSLLATIWNDYRLTFENFYLAHRRVQRLEHLPHRVWSRNSQKSARYYTM